MIYSEYSCRYLKILTQTSYDSKQIRSELFMSDHRIPYPVYLSLMQGITGLIKITK